MKLASMNVGGGPRVVLGVMLCVIALAGCGGGGGHSSSSAATPSTSEGSQLSPTPAEVKKATKALADCQQEQPGTTLRQLEQEAAGSLGIQC